MGLIGWWGSHVSHSDQVPTSHVILAAIICAPFVLAWVLRNR
jgi:heme A synthase